MGYPAVILAGGRSRRMGQDKASLCVDARPLLNRVAAALSEAGCERLLVQVRTQADVERLGHLLTEFDVEWGLDDPTRHGVLDGLRCGLQTAEFLGWDIVQLTPVDTPWVSPALFRGLAGMLDDGVEAVVPTTATSLDSPSKGVEPLLACLRVRSTLKALRGLEDSEDSRLAMMFERMNTCYVDSQIWSRWGVEEREFQNLNNPEDVI